jgi:hypothetical protein
VDSRKFSHGLLILAETRWVRKIDMSENTDEVGGPGEELDWLTNYAHDKRPSRLPSVPTYFPSSARPYTESTSSRPRCLDQPGKCFPSENVRVTISLPLRYRGISCEILRSLRGFSGSDTCFAFGPCSEDSNPRDSTTTQHLRSRYTALEPQHRENDGNAFWII